ncbi:MAG TPA: hypothetical protein VKJ01_21340, partial [Candidatus Solibacter sp.]|nr:hypothetical protein [Candidatus Solibacter sp.]
MHEQVPKRRRIEHVGIVEGGEPGPPCLDAQVLVVGRQFRKCSTPIGISPALVRHQPFKSNAPMRTYP